MAAISDSHSFSVRNDAILAVGIFALALMIRWGVLGQIDSIPFMQELLVDAESYDAWARRIIDGNWLGDEMFYQAPAYPYFLAVIYTLFGDDPSVVHRVQIMLGAVSCVLTFFGTKMVYDRDAGIAAALLLALYPPAIFFDVLIQKASLGLFWICLLLLLLAIFQRRPGIGRACACGVVLGGLALTRENALVFIFAIPLWMALRFRTEARLRVVTWVAAFAMGTMIVLFPIAVRNQVVGDSFSLTTSQAGTNFYLGNHAGASGVYEPLVPGRHTPEFEGPDATRLAQEALARPLRPSEVSRYWLGQGLAFIRDAPGEWLVLMVTKTAMTFDAFEIPDTEDIYLYADESWLLGAILSVLHFGVLLPLAAAGIWMVGRRESAWLHLMLAAAFAFSVVLFYVFARYRYPLVPLLIPLAGFAVAETLRRARAKDWLGVLGPGIVAMMVAALSNQPLPDESVYRATSFINLSAIHLEANRFDEAQRALDRAQALSPESAEVHFQLGALRYQQRRLEDAEAHLRRSLGVEPTDYRPHLLLAKVLLERGRLKEAMVHRAQAKKWKPKMVFEVQSGAAAVSP